MRTTSVPWVKEEDHVEMNRLYFFGKQWLTLFRIIISDFSFSIICLVHQLSFLQEKQKRQRELSYFPTNSLIEVYHSFQGQRSTTTWRKCSSCVLKTYPLIKSRLVETDKLNFAFSFFLNFHAFNHSCCKFQYQGKKVRTFVHLKFDLPKILA